MTLPLIGFGAELMTELHSYLQTTLQIKSKTAILKIPIPTLCVVILY